MLKWYVFIGCWGSLLFGQETLRLQVNALDVKPGKDEVFLSSLGQLSTDGQRLYISGNDKTEIVVVDRDGNIERMIGGMGGHPAEFEYQGILGFSLSGNTIWGIDMELKRVRRFEDGEYQSSFPLQSFNITRMTPGENMFAFSRDFVVIPTNEIPEHLAAVYQTDGTFVANIGEPMDFSRMVHERILGMNDTHWLAYGENWISIHKFFPLVNIYDSSFALIDQIQVESPLISHLVDVITEAAPEGERYGIPTPVFSDAQIVNDDLFLMCPGYLHQVNMKKRKVTSITSFFGKGPDFKGVEMPNLAFYLFAILDDGTLILGHPAMLWNHDLWRTKLPFLATPQN
jgi:hypothetical protein